MRSQGEHSGRGWEAVAVAGILLASAVLRLYGIGWLPPGIFQDEAINGVNAQTILAGMPRLYYGEREPLFMYLAALGTLILGYTPLALHVTSALSGMVGVAAIGALARQLFGRRIGLLAAAGAGASLWLTTIGRIGLRAVTLPAVESLGLALLWRATRTGRRRDYALAGGVLGLSLYTYLSSRFVPIALVVFLALGLAFYRSWARPRLGGFVLAGLAAIVICLPLGAYALRHPEIVLGRPDQVALPGGRAYLPALLDAIARTFGMFAVRGDANWRHNLSGAPVFDPLSFAVFLVGLLVALSWRKPESLLTLVFGFVMITPSMLSIDSPHYLRTIGAAWAIYTLWALGLDRVARWAGRLVVGREGAGETAPRAVSTVAARLLGHVPRHLWPGGLSIPLAIAQPPGDRSGGAGILPARVPGTRAGRMPAPPGEPPSPTDRLGFRQRDRSSGVEAARGAASVLVTAIVLVVAFGRTGKDYFVDYARSPEMRAAFNANLAAIGRFIAASPVWKADRANVYVTDDYRDNFGTIAYFLYPRLRPAERPGWFDERTIGIMFRPSETIPLPVAPSLYVDAPDDRAAVTALGRSVRQLTPILDGGQVVAQAILADVSPPDPASASSPVHAQLGRWLELESAQVAPGLVALRWRVLARPTYQPSIFVHLEDAAGHTLATSDQVIGFPIAAWRIGQELVSRHRLQAPPGTPPGSYPISAGVYDKTTGQRETAVIDGGVVGRVEVGQVALAAPVPGAPTVQHPDARPVAAGLDLLGYDVPEASAEAGAVVPFALVWQARDPRRPDDQVTVALRAADGTTLAQWHGAPGGPAFPTSRWAAGTIVRQLLDLPVPATFQGVATLDVTGDGPDGPGAPAELTRLTVKGTAHVFDPPNPRRRLDASFAGVGALVGADLPDGALAAGSTVMLTLYWRAAGASPTSYTVFVHLLDAGSHVVGQRDEPPARGTRPTTGWVAGEFVADPHEFAIDPGAAAGTYQVEVGLYDPRTGARVATGTPDNRIVIAQVQVR